MKKEFFRNGVFLTLTIVMLFGGLSAALLYFIGISTADDILQEHNRAVKYFIDSHFSKIHNTVNFLASEPLIVHAMELDPKRREEVLRLYRALELSDPDINYIYSGYEDGSLLINNYTPPPGFDPRIRPWYRAAIEAAPEISGGVPYREIKTREWLVSISKVLRDEHNCTLGVVSIDSSIVQIEKILRAQVGSYRSSYSFVVDPRGKILLHPDFRWLGKNISELVGAPVHFPSKLRNKSRRLEFDGKILYYIGIDNLKWIVVTVAKRSEIFRPIVIDILGSVFLIGAVAVLLSWLLSIRLSRQVVEPVSRLEGRVRAILDAKVSREDPYRYPDNEIGMIAKEIEHLTEKELYKRNRALRRANKKLKILSEIDRLTGLYNRRKMNPELEREWSRAQRYGSRFSLMMLDIDWFKKINDTYGHQAGDAVLKALARLIRRTLRKTDIPCRWGGEEFLILLPETNLEEAKLLAERIRHEVESYPFPGHINVTLSIGVHQFDGEERLEKMIKETDDMLYAAKKAGRNRVMAG